MGFLDNIFKDDKKKKSGGGIANPFANLGGGGRGFQGQGQSLGGTQPGTVLSITLPNEGSLGVRVSIS
jgi:hypothetical protein